MKKALVVLLCFVLLLTSACSNGGTNGSNPYGGTPDKDMVTIDLREEPSQLNSMVATDNIVGNVLRATMSGLTKLDKNDTPQPNIAESWDVSEDGKTYTFHLRKDAKWSNGEPVTAKDFIFTWTTTMTPATAAASASHLSNIIKNGNAYYEGQVPASDLGISAVDDYTLKVELESALPDAASLFAASFFLPINQKAYETIGPEQYGKDKDKIVTNGPYNISEWVHDDHILLEQNKSFFDASTIYIPKIKLVMLNDGNTRVNAFKAGQLDLFDPVGDEIAQLQSEGNGIVKEYSDNNTWYLQFNTSSSMLSNQKIRNALGKVVDVQSLCDEILKDGSIISNGYVPPKIGGVNDKTYAEARGDIYKTDLAEGKKLMEEGLKEINKQASDIKLKMISHDGELSQTQAAYFQDQWKTKLGIDVEIQVMPFTSFVEALEAGNFDVVFSGWGAEYDDAMGFLSVFKSGDVNNYGRYNNPEYDNLIEAGLKESDMSKRQEKMIAAEKLLIKEAAISPMYFTNIPYATSAKLTGIVRTGFQEMNFIDGMKIVEQ